MALDRAALCGLAADARRGRAAAWLGDDLPLPLPVKTPQDIGFKSAAERQYLIFNLMAGGKLAFQRGDYATAVDKWETLLRMPGLDPQIEAAVAPFLDDARAGRARQAGAGHAVEPAARDPCAATGQPPRRAGATGGGARRRPRRGAPHRAHGRTVSVSGQVVAAAARSARAAR